jgi:glycosyltransferase involved in cell wall biosynthesis
MEKFSVIICSYNPDGFVFKKCLNSINSACDQYKPYEIIIVDNNSSTPISNEGYVKEFIRNNSNARIVIEKKQGLTPARLRGIEEANGEILVFIDDDNWVKADFFKKGVDIASKFRHIGSWSGQVNLHFEEKPEEWTRRYWGLLVFRELEQDRWSNFPHLTETMPCGAGLFVRKTVADHYHKLHKTGKRDIQLDRSGESLFSGGDNDLAACACDIGLGVGLFHELVLEHYIPSKRLKKDYLIKLAEGIAASSIVFRSFRGELPVKPSLKTLLANRIRLTMKTKMDRCFYAAVLKGEKNGREILRARQCAI